LRIIEFITRLKIIEAKINFPNNYDVIILGSGIGGLICASYLVKNTKLKVLLVEKNNVAGGLTSGFYRGNYYFESGTVGISIAGYFKELLDDLKPGLGSMINTENYKISINDRISSFTSLLEIPDKIEGIFPKSKQQLINFFKELSTDLKLVKNIMKHNNPLKWFDKGLFYKFKTILKTLFLVVFNLGYFIKYLKLDKKKYFEKCFPDQTENPTYFLSNLTPYKNMNLIIYSEIWNEFINGVGYVKNGFLNFVKILLRNFKEKGGEILLNAEVQKIYVKDGKVTGIRTRKGEYNSKYCISNIDLKKMVSNLVGEEHFSRKFINKVKKAEVSESLLIAYIGLKMDKEELKKHIPSHHIMYLSEDFKSVGSYEAYFKTCPLIVVPLYYLSENIMKKGYSSIILEIPVSDEIDIRWGKLTKGEYAEIKNKIKDIIASRMEKMIPDFKDRSELMDIATPKTIEKWVGTTNGASNGFSWSLKDSFLKTKSFTKLFLKTELKNLYQVGAFSTANGGVFFSALTGKLVANMICKKI
jgi:all-trans-retinol 13,14-reductase